MKTLIKPIPVEFDAAVALSVAQDQGYRPDQYIITATHQTRPGIWIRKPFDAPRGATLADLTNLNVWRHELPLSWEHIVTALWVSDSEAYELVETFENAPIGIAEIRANKAGDASRWKPRDALVDLLRKIDSNEQPNMDALVIAWRQKSPQNEISSFYAAASPDVNVTLGVLSRAEYMIQQGVTPG